MQQAERLITGLAQAVIGQQTNTTVKAALIFRYVNIGHVVTKRPVSHTPCFVLIFDNIFNDKSGFIANIIAGITVGIAGIPGFNSNIVSVIVIAAK